jgi:branched-chain amino acid transport system permease protein
MNLQSILIIPAWFSLLALPFLGVAGSLRLGAVLLAGSITVGFVRAKGLALLWSIWENLSVRIETIKRKAAKIDGRIAVGALIIVLLTLPFGLNRYSLDIAIIAGIYIILALGLNIVVGLAGLLALGYIAFYAVGAYAFAILSTKYHLSFWLALPVGGIIASLFGLLLGAPTLRLRGDYLAIVTLGFGEITRIVLNNWDELTGGPNGIMGIGRPEVFGYRFQTLGAFYYLILAMVVFTAFSVRRLNDSRIGRAWVAIREDEVAAEAMGIDTVRMKLLAFSLSASIAGIAGVFYAAKMSFVSPESFTFLESIIILCMVVLGGIGSIPGVILGAVVLIVLPESLREFQDYRMIVFGASMVLMMAFRPQGLLGGSRRRLELEPVDERTLEHEVESLYDAKRGEKV